MAAHGSSGEFNSDMQGDLDSLHKQTKKYIYFLANDVECEEKQEAFILSMCGASTYQLIRNSVDLNRPNKKHSVRW